MSWGGRYSGEGEIIGRKIPWERGIQERDMLWGGTMDIPRERDTLGKEIPWGRKYPGGDTLGGR